MEQVELPQLLACPEQVALLQITLNRTPNGSCNFVLARSAPRPAEKLPALSRRRKKGAGCSVGQISFYVLPCEHFFWRGIVALLYPDAKPPKQILTCGKSVHQHQQRRHQQYHHPQQQQQRTIGSQGDGRICGRCG